MLPVDGEYETPRLKEIAKRQHELLAELEGLDVEILSLCKPGLRPVEEFTRSLRP